MTGNFITKWRPKETGKPFFYVAWAFSQHGGWFQGQVSREEPSRSHNEINDLAAEVNLHHFIIFYWSGHLQKPIQFQREVVNTLHHLMKSCQHRILRKAYWMGYIHTHICMYVICMKIQQKYIRPFGGDFKTLLSNFNN